MKNTYKMFLLGLSMLFIVSCSKKEDPAPLPTTGNLSVSVKITQRSTGAVVPDNKLSGWVLTASLFSESNALLKTETFNSSTINFNNINPGNYKVTAQGNVTLNAVNYSFTGGLSGGQVQVGKTATGPEMVFYY
jgi:hypothetical protein